MNKHEKNNASFLQIIKRKKLKNTKKRLILFLFLYKLFNLIQLTAYRQF